MIITGKTKKREMPQYSLTGDLLAFKRCGLQYRYHSGSSLPPSRPVQFWFGDFIHGVLEAAFKIWDKERGLGFPWPMSDLSDDVTEEEFKKTALKHDIRSIGISVEKFLRLQGKSARSEVVKNFAYKRAEKAINVLGPDLFPLIASAETRIRGTRGSLGTEDVYELNGIVDVLTKISIEQSGSQNLFSKRLLELANSDKNQLDDFEVIVDYKGSRRPSISQDYWSHGEWQIQTYAWLRSQQPEALSVKAGMLLYINELVPSSEDIESLKNDIRNNDTDILPIKGSEDEYKILAFRYGETEIPSLSLEFRLERAIRIITIDPHSQKNATGEFDKLVVQIEECVEKERNDNTITAAWIADGEIDSCETCDFRYSCPKTLTINHGIKKAPDAP